MIWAGIDAGKTHHHCVAIDESGRRLLSRRVANDDPGLLELLTAVLALGDELTWGIDLADGAALVITILFSHEQSVHYISGRAIHRAAESYRRGQDRCQGRRRHRRSGPHPPRPAPLTHQRRDGHRPQDPHRPSHGPGRRPHPHREPAPYPTRRIFPGLERALDLTNTGPLVLLTGYQTPAALRRTGKKRLETWLRNRRVLRADRLAEIAWEAAGRQHTSLPGERLTAQMVHTLAAEVISLNQQIGEIDKAIEARFREHRDFEVITSMPGLGVILGAEFLAATGGDMTAFGTADRLAGFGGVAPVPRDSGKISGNLRHPRRYNRRLQRVFYISALFSIRHCDESRRFYERKRAEGKRHIQAVLALARRRVNVLWALLRDGRTYEPLPPTALAA